MTGDVSPLDSGNEAAARSRLRASHEDRDHVAEQLRLAAGDGRLTAEELDHRLGIALIARTNGELAALTADLPGSDQQPAATARELAGVARIDSGSSSVKRTGSWRVPQRLEVRVASGKVMLDFTEAVVTHPEVHIDADIRSGSLVIVTKPGMVVDATAVAVGSGEVKVRSPWGLQVPVTLRIEVTGEAGSAGHHGHARGRQAHGDSVRAGRARTVDHRPASARLLDTPPELVWPHRRTQAALRSLIGSYRESKQDETAHVCKGASRMDRANYDANCATDLA